MSDEEQQKPKDDGPGIPAWVMTFADLMSLLMCFFVLLLSFAELDVKRFKQIAGSLKMAFGVQRDVKAADIPMGTSMIAREFSPGRPDNTLLQDVRQRTTEKEKENLEKMDEKPENSSLKQAEKLQEELSAEIEAGKIEIETDQEKIIIRILEKGAFPSADAEFEEDFGPVMAAISAVLQEVKGNITIAGHTDNLPINTRRYRSNWELSTARAVTVAHGLLQNPLLDPTRITVTGHGDTQPRAENNSAANRALNRRVEIIIVKGDDIQEVGDGSDEVVEIDELIPAPTDGEKPEGTQGKAQTRKTLGERDDVELFPVRKVEPPPQAKPKGPPLPAKERLDPLVRDAMLAPFEEDGRVKAGQRRGVKPDDALQ